MVENTLHFSLKKTSQCGRLPKIVVMGVGGGGCNAINNMMGKKIEGVEFIAANTDIQSLASSKAERTIQLGKNTTKGQGAGSYPEVGLASAEEAREEIEEALKDVQLLFLTAGMGGGTGTGAAPAIAKIAKEKDILTIAVVTKPFQYEAELRVQLAEQGISELKKYVDTMIVLPNENLFRVANKETTLQDAFALSDNVLYLGVRGITDLITMPGLINLDFADVRMVIRKMGRAMMGMGEAEGENRAIRAVEEALSNPLLEDINIKGAMGALVNITGSPDITLFEFDEAAKRIREEIGGERAIIKVGTAFMKELEGKIRVSIFATGIQEKGGSEILNIVAEEEIKNKITKEEKREQIKEDYANKNEEEQREEKEIISEGKKERVSNRTRTRLASNPNGEEADFFDIGSPCVEDEVSLDEKKSVGLFFGLFENFSKKNNEKEEIDNKETGNKINTFRSKNREIEFKNNSSQNRTDEKTINIPAYLRNKK